MERKRSFTKEKEEKKKGELFETMKNR